MYEVIGKRIVDYVKNGERKMGVELHCTGSFERNDGQGTAVERIYLSDRTSGFNAACDVQVGDSIRAYFNRYGNYDSVEVVK